MPIPRPIPGRTLAALIAAALLAGCGGGDGPTQQPPPPAALGVSSTGRLERGGVVELAATQDGQPLAAGAVTWSVAPADAGQVLEGGRLRLLRAGDVQVRATAGERTGTATLQVAVPPTVVFEMAVSGNRDIYRVALDGGDLGRLTAHTASDADPTVAGGTVVFISFRDGNAEMYSMPVGGGAETRLTTTPGRESAPALSRDGQRLAFAAGAVASKVWTAAPTGAGPVAAAPGFGFPGSPETSPAWAPTGDRLAFVGTATGAADVYQLVPGGQPALLAGGPRAEIDPAWSPDGERVAFASTRDGGADIYLVKVADGAITRLSTRAGDEAEPTWTPDGRLVYVEFESSGATRLVWIDPASPATVHPIPVAGGNPRAPAATQ